MENLAFSLNATIPIFLLMVIGFIFRMTGLFDDTFANKLNNYVFTIGIPVSLFKSISESNFHEVWDGKMVLFCVASTAAMILIMVAVSYFLKDKSIQGEFIQGGFRSSQALLGVAFLENIYGHSTALSLIVIGSVPLYNIGAVIILTLFKQDRGKLDSKLVASTLKKVVTNPIIIGIVLGFLWSFLDIPEPTIMKKTVASVAATASPMGLMALGACIDLKKMFGSLKPAVVCSAFKLFIFPALFLPMAIALGFQTDKLVSILIMLGSSATVSGFNMAKSMGHDGTLTASTVMLTTIFSSFSLTVWLYLIRSLGLV